MEYTLVEQVKIRKGQYEVGDDGSIKWTDLQDNPRIEQHIEEIKQEIRNKRNYPSDYTNEQIEEDMKRYTSNIVNLVVYDLSQAGEEYMASFGENGVSRSWIDRNKLLADVFPFVEIL